ncbi:MAG: molecular chaperone HtpG [Tenericutes bacterium]|nr:molecular chaperone HtpG [Mycoplasmatota bacterium]MDY3801773.1 molecular chaperone HtpG [Bacilli bacterium]
MKKKQFKSESVRLLDLMINSIYTNKDIFLRELISNSSDAIDKLYYRSLTDKELKVNTNDLKIEIIPDHENRTLTIIDNGIGMTQDELENNLGTIAKSGSLSFKEENKDQNDVNIIGQFGVGFYSSFMVSKEVKVYSKHVDSQKAYLWDSCGTDGYTIEETDVDFENGTKIVIYLKDNNEDVQYDEYLDEYKIRELVKKYSDYIKYPIQMEVMNNVKKENSDEYEEVKEIDTLNSMKPLWNKEKSEITDEEYNNFYSDKFYDYQKPMKTIHFSVEGLCSYKSILFIPSHTPYDFYTKEYKKGLQLYSNGVLIMDKCEELLPDYFAFVRGVVDTEDLSLNISREMLQQDKKLKQIAKSIEKKLINEFKNMMETDFEKYKELFKNFGPSLKFGTYNNYGIDKDKLKDLLIFYSKQDEDFVTLKKYVENLKDDQKSIYYVCGESVEKINHLPLVEKVQEKGYNLLYLTDAIDEFVFQILNKYDDHEFINIASEKFDLNTEEEKEEINKINKDNKKLLDIMKDCLKDKVSNVKFTNSLKTHPVCLTTEGQVSLEMEKVLNAMPTDDKVKANVVLEINENHKIADKIKKLYDTDKEELEKYTKILYSQARLIEGLEIDNPTEITNLICEIISEK